jgi:uncharacterized protein DUF4437
MTQKMTNRIINLTGALALSWTAILASVPAALSETAIGEIALPAEQLVFENLNPAISMADAYGDRSNSAHGTFGRFPGEFLTPVHTHTNAYSGVVINGVMTNPFGGEENPPEMGPGSYWHVPGGSVHATACVSKEPCEFYFHSDGFFDFIPVE